MSRIWQALRQAERERAIARQEGPNIEEMDREHAVSEEEAVQSAGPSERDRRKGLRHSHAALLLVYGSNADKQPFHEESETIDANENGCLFVLDSDVSKGQKLFLTNMRNQAEQECRVVYVGRRVKGKIRVGVEFPRPIPQFWRLA
jgi:hypothetical protein